MRDEGKESDIRRNGENWSAFAGWKEESLSRYGIPVAFKLGLTQPDDSTRCGNQLPVESQSIPKCRLPWATPSPRATSGTKPSVDELLWGPGPNRAEPPAPNGAWNQSKRPELSTRRHSYYAETPASGLRHSVFYFALRGCEFSRGWWSTTRNSVTITEQLERLDAIIETCFYASFVLQIAVTDQLPVPINVIDLLRHRESFHIQQPVGRFQIRILFQHIVSF